MALQRALGEKSLSAYLKEKIVRPLGMEQHVKWNVYAESDSLEKAFCCLNISALDVAKFGQLYLHKGNWEGTQVVPSHWVKKSLKLDESSNSSRRYQYHWWVNDKKGNQFSAKGFRGQYVFLDLEKELMIVRFGKNRGGLLPSKWTRTFQQLAKNL